MGESPLGNARVTAVLEDGVMLEAGAARSDLSVDQPAPPTELAIGHNLVDAVAAVASAPRGAEVGGLLAGTGATCSVVRPILNTIPSTHSAYVPDPEAYRRELANIHELGLRPIGWFHSHWEHGHRPSPADRPRVTSRHVSTDRLGRPPASSLVCSLVGRRAPGVACRTDCVMTISLVEVAERSLFTVPWVGESMTGVSSAPPPELPAETDLAWVAGPADQVVEALRPALRALMLAGRRPQTISVGGVLGSPASSHPWIVMDIEARSFVEVASLVVEGPPADATVVAEIVAAPEFHSAEVIRLLSLNEPADLAALTLAVELPASPQGTLLFDLPTTDDGRIVLWSTGSTTSQGAFSDLAEVAAVACESIAAQLEPVWALLTSPSVTGFGLLWLFDPANWIAEGWEFDDTEHTRAKRALERVGGRALYGIAGRDPIADFLGEQMDGVGSVGEQLTGWFPQARAKNLRTQVARLLATGSVVTPQRVDSWAGACWFDLILSRARLEVLRPPALPSPSVIVSAADEDEESCEFVTSRTNEDVTTLWLAVTGPDELRADLIGVAEGAPLDEVIAWELVQRPDEKDLLVVVAAPGVQITLPAVNPWWDWKIIRVQDRAMVPPAGQPIVIDALLAPFPIVLEVPIAAPLPPDQETPPDLPVEGIDPIGGEPMAMLFPTETGCRIEYPVYENGQRLGDPIFVAELEVNPLSGVDRYAFDVLLGLFPESPDFSGSIPMRRAARFTFWVSSMPLLKLTYSVLHPEIQFEYWLVPGDVELPRFGESLPTGIPLAFFLPPGVLTPGGAPHRGLRSARLRRVVDGRVGPARPPDRRRIRHSLPTASFPASGR